MQEILAQEIEALKEIYLNDLTVSNNLNNDFELKFNLTPTTGEKINEKWVSMTLCFYLSTEYPFAIPTMKFFNPRGLLEQHTNSIMECLNNMADDKIGYQMIFELVEQAKEMLTKYNLPHVQCMICLEDLSTSANCTFIRTSCLHYFHTYCLHRYVQFTKDSLNSSDEKSCGVVQAAATNGLICPVCRDDISEDFVNTGSSFNNKDEIFSDANFVYVPDENMQQLQVKMKKQIETQRSKGGIIDQEVEKKRFDLPKDFVYQGLKQKEQLEKDKLNSEILNKLSETNIDANQKNNLSSNKRIFNYKQHNNKFNKNKNTINGNYRSNREQYKGDCHAGNKYKYEDKRDNQDGGIHDDDYANKNKYRANRGYHKNYSNRSKNKCPSTGGASNNYNDSNNQPSNNLLSTVSNESNLTIIDLPEKNKISSNSECSDIINNDFSQKKINMTKMEIINNSNIGFDSDKTSLDIKVPIRVDPLLINHLKQGSGKQYSKNYKGNHEKYNCKNEVNRFNTNYSSFNRHTISEDKDEIKKGSIEKNGVFNDINHNIGKTFDEKLHLSKEIISRNDKRHNSNNRSYINNNNDLNNYDKDTNYLDDFNRIYSRGSNGLNQKIKNIKDCKNSNISSHNDIGIDSNKSHDRNNSKINDCYGDTLVGCKKFFYNKSYSKAGFNSKNYKTNYCEESKIILIDQISTNVNEDNILNINIYSKDNLEAEAADEHNFNGNNSGCQNNNLNESKINNGNDNFRN